MLVLKTNSPTTSPVAPKERPSHTLPSANASKAFIIFYPPNPWLLIVFVNALNPPLELTISPQCFSSPGKPIKAFFKLNRLYFLTFLLTTIITLPFIINLCHMFGNHVLGTEPNKYTE